MKLPGFRRLFTQDFPSDYKDLIDKLSTTLNNGIEFLYTLGNKNITLGDNVSCTVKDITVSVDSNGTPRTSTSFILDEAVKTRQVIGLNILNIQNTTNSSNLPSYQPYVGWSQSGGAVIINKINGLPPSDTFLIK
jgi:hypothetical protein